MPVNLIFTFKNKNSEYMETQTPLAFTNNKANAFSLQEYDDLIDYDFIKDKLMPVLETVYTNSVLDYLAIEISIHEGADIPIYELITTDSSFLAHALPNNLQLTSQTKDVCAFIATNVSNEMLDLLLKCAASGGLSKAIDEIKNTVEDALGKPKGINAADARDIEGLIEAIRAKTQADIVKPKETLADYVCNSVLQEELNEIVDFFNNRQTYANAKIDLPKGILFKGPFGTGKTFAARCIAGSVDCYFMTCTASALQGQYIGSGAENIRNIFRGARELAKISNKGVIIFIDELDSFGSRDNHGGNAGGEEDRTLNQLLAEMSGFTDEDIDIMLLAATNFPERLDGALTRSGRFGRQITIDYPDEYERLEMVKHYVNKINLPLDKGCDVNDICMLTESLTPADIKEIINEAGILTIRHKRTEVSLDDVNEAINKVITKNIRHPDKKELLDVVTSHECGHVLAEYIFNKTIPIKVTNYAYGDAGGFTQPGYVNSGITDRESYLNRVRMLLGGRAAEAAYCKYITTGASSDLRKAKALLYDYYKVYHFEAYEAKELDQIVLDKLDDLYVEVVQQFVNNHSAKLTTLITELGKKRVLYMNDLVGILK